MGWDGKIALTEVYLPIKKPRKDWVVKWQWFGQHIYWNLVCTPVPECGFVFDAVLWEKSWSAAPGMVTRGSGGNARARTPQSSPLR